MVIVKQQQIALEEWLTYARAFLAPSLQQSTPQESNRDLLSQGTKGEPRQKIRKNKEPTNENDGTDKNESESKRKHLWLIQSWHWTMIAESPISTNEADILNEGSRQRKHTHPDHG